MLMSELLENEFAKNNVVCEIKVYNVDEEDEEYEHGLRYDIHVFFNEKYTRTGGMYGFVVATNKKINKLLFNWFGLSIGDYYVSTSSKDC